jgi:hypothetical protein
MVGGRASNNAPADYDGACPVRKIRHEIGLVMSWWNPPAKSDLPVSSPCQRAAICRSGEGAGFFENYKQKPHMST